MKNKFFKKKTLLFLSFIGGVSTIMTTVSCSRLIKDKIGNISSKIKKTIGVSKSGDFITNPGNFQRKDNDNNQKLTYEMKEQILKEELNKIIDNYGFYKYEFSEIKFQLNNKLYQRGYENYPEIFESDLISSKINEVIENGRYKIKLVKPQESIYDENINNSLYRGIERFADYNSKTYFDYVDFSSEYSLHDTYNQLLTEDINVWVLAGPEHGNLSTGFLDWIKKDDNKSKFDEKKIIVVGVDWDFDKNKSTIMRASSLFTLKYKLEEAAWIAGYVAAKYVAENESKPEQRTLATFGKSSEIEVTNYIKSFLVGIHLWNETNDKKVKLSHDELALDLSPNSHDFSFFSNLATSKIDRILKKNNPKIIFPVVDNYFRHTIQKINSQQSIVGILPDQLKEFKDYKYSGKYFALIEKEYSSTIFKILKDLYDSNSSINSNDSLIHKTPENNGNLSIFVGIKNNAVHFSDDFYDNYNVKYTLDTIKNTLNNYLDESSNDTNINDNFSEYDRKEELNELIQKINSQYEYSLNSETADTHDYNDYETKVSHYEDKNITDTSSEDYDDSEEEYDDEADYVSDDEEEADYVIDDDADESDYVTDDDE
ncbi:hypothetical protein [[Mycoplasma] collis]|uniref:hypothetical protein n=1 Tax=[Mycoplasma] collis TaxID=2127 RepID=UPI000A9B8CEA|nr:hypothetical protein [[Mycoplasma] collis]